MSYFAKINNFTIPLKEKFENNVIEDIFIDSFKSYKIELHFELEEVDRVEKCDIIISGETFTLDNDDEVNIFKTERGNYFNCIYGYSYLIFKIYYKNGEEKFIFSDLIEVLFEEKLEEHSNKLVTKMIEFIETYDTFEKFSLDEVKHSIINANKSPKRNLNLQVIIAKIEQIIKVYKECKPYFLNNLRFKIIEKEKKVDLEKASYISIKTLNGIISNVDELIPHDKETFIKDINKKSYLPKKVVVDNNFIEYNILENKMVLSFLVNILNFINDNILRIKEDPKFKTNAKVRKEEEFYCYRDNIVGTIQLYYNQLVNLQKEVEYLYFEYSKLMKCDIINFYSLLPMTQIFKTYHHYRRIYELFIDWFEICGQVYLKYNIFTTFYTLDDLYEYFCLVKLKKIFIELGFKIVKEDEYQYKAKTFISRGVNTFVLYDEKGNRVTLYYQPFIYNNKSTNSLKLIRVKNNNNYYNPDFIIQIKKYNEEKEHIYTLDAKWKKNIDKTTEESVINKYAYFLEKINRLDEYRAVIILIGRSRREIVKSYLEENKVENKVNTIGISFTAEVSAEEKLIEKFKSILEKN